MGTPAVPERVAGGDPSDDPRPVPRREEHFLCDIVPGPGRTASAAPRPATRKPSWSGKGRASHRDRRHAGPGAAGEGKPALPPIDTDQTDGDFACFISTRPVPEDEITRILERGKDPRVLLWSPGELRLEERERLLDFAAYRKLVADWEGKDTETPSRWSTGVANSLQTELGRIYRIVPDPLRPRSDRPPGSSGDGVSRRGELTNILARWSIGS